MNISILIVNYRGWKALAECLNSLENYISKTLTFEVIVIDNFSNDGQFTTFKLKYPNFTFIENIGNNGFSNGCNRAAIEAKGKYLLFLNPDTKIQHQALETLLQTADSYPEIGILSCLQIDEKGSYYKQNLLFPAFGRFLGLSRSLYKTIYKKNLIKRFSASDGLFYPDWVTGAVIFISRSWFDKIKGWSEDYWLYFEDVAICKKVTEFGGKIAVTQNATIFHQHGGASRINVKTKALTKTEVIISKHVYINNQFSTSKRVVLNVLLIIGVLIEKSFLAFISLFLFFIPKLKVNRLIIQNLLSYYYNAFKNRTWLSPRSVNYLKKA